MKPFSVLLLFTAMVAFSFIWDQHGSMDRLDPSDWVFGVGVLGLIGTTIWIIHKATKGHFKS